MIFIKKELDPKKYGLIVCYEEYERDFLISNLSRFKTTIKSVDVVPDYSLDSDFPDFINKYVIKVELIQRNYASWLNVQSMLSSNMFLLCKEYGYCIDF